MLNIKRRSTVYVCMYNRPRESCIELGRKFRRIFYISRTAAWISKFGNRAIITGKRKFGWTVVGKHELPHSALRLTKYLQCIRLHEKTPKTTQACRSASALKCRQENLDGFQHFPRDGDESADEKSMRKRERGKRMGKKAEWEEEDEMRNRFAAEGEYGLEKVFVADEFEAPAPPIP